MPPPPAEALTSSGKPTSRAAASRPCSSRGANRALPVAEMRYWVVGVPAPGEPAEETLGDDHRLASLSQSGWQVRFDRYQAVGPLELPSRIEMTTDGLRLRVVASDWSLPP